MKFLVLLAVIVLANGAPNHMHYKTIMPRLPVLPNAPKYETGSSRIVGGEVAEPNSWPWQVYIIIDDAFFCGGSLIGLRSVMTAAHCTTDSDLIEVHLGAQNNPDNSYVIASTDIVTNAAYDSNSISEDIGMVRLPQDVVLSDKVAIGKIPLATDNPVAAGTTVTATGWGKDSDSATGTSSVLRQVTTTTISNVDCALVYGDEAVPDSKVCIDASEGKGTCNGDSGGPLHLDDKTIIGITSYGAAAGCEEGYPDAFTRVQSYLDWIAENRGD